MDLEQLHKYGEELERRLRLKTYPIAIKMIEKESEIPAGAKRALKDMGTRMDICQAFATSRRDGTTMAMLLQDNWCCEPVIGFGLAAPPKEFMRGENRFPQDVASLEAGSHYAEDLPKLPSGKYIGVLSAPLSKTPFIPTRRHLRRLRTTGPLLLAREHKDGHDLNVNISSHAACVYGVVPSIKSGECHVAVPCRGDHYAAMAGDAEMIFSMPLSKLEEIIAGLRFLETTGSRLPRNYRMKKEPEHAESYFRIARLMACWITNSLYSESIIKAKRHLTPGRGI